MTQEKLGCEDIHLRKSISNEAGLLAHVPIAPGGPFHLHPGLVQLLPDVVAEDVPDVLLARQLLPPHLQQLQLGALAGKVEEVVILQLPKSRGVGFAPTAVGEFVPVASSVDVRLWSLGPKDRSHLFLEMFVRLISWINVHTSSVFLAGSAESLNGRGFLMSDQRPRFFRMAVLDTSLCAE